MVKDARDVAARIIRNLYARNNSMEFTSFGKPELTQSENGFAFSGLDDLAYLMLEAVGETDPPFIKKQILTNYFEIELEKIYNLHDIHYDEKIIEILAERLFIDLIGSDTCSKCKGIGKVSMAELCNLCNGTGQSLTSNRKFAELLGIHKNTYRDKYKPHYVLIYSQLNEIFQRAINHINRRGR